MELATVVPDDTEVIAGLGLGGIPVVTALGGHGPSLRIRPQGGQVLWEARLAEGAEVSDRRVLVVEDVVHLWRPDRDLRGDGPLFAVVISRLENHHVVAIHEIHQAVLVCDAT